MLGVTVNGTTVTAAVANAPEPLVAVAVMVADPGVFPALNEPEELMEPTPVTDHKTGAFAVKASVPFCKRVAVLGVIVIGVTVTSAVPVAPDPLWAVAVIVADPAEMPAVKRPLDVMVPSPVTDHVDGVLAVNCRVVPAIKVTVAGVTLMGFTVTEALAVAPDPL